MVKINDTTFNYYSYYRDMNDKTKEKEEEITNLESSLNPYDLDIEIKNYDLNQELPRGLYTNIDRCTNASRCCGSGSCNTNCC